MTASNQTAIQTESLSRFRELYDKQKEGDKLHYARKLAEIDYMLFTIDRHEVFKQSAFYQERNVSDLKVLLAKRIMTFAQAEEHRDYGFRVQWSSKKYAKKD